MILRAILLMRKKKCSRKKKETPGRINLPSSSSSPSPATQQRLPPLVQRQVLSHPGPQRLELAPYLAPKQVAHRGEVPRDGRGAHPDARGRDGRGAERRRGALELVHRRVDRRGPGLSLARGIGDLGQRLVQLVELLGRVGEVERRDLGDEVRVGLVLVSRFEAAFFFVDFVRGFRRSLAPSLLARSLDRSLSQSFSRRLLLSPPLPNLSPILPPHLELPKLRKLLVEDALHRRLRDDLVHAAGDFVELGA